MTVHYDDASIRAVTSGLRVRRDASLPPATGESQDLFTVDGGQVLLFGFVGYVTVAIPNVSLDFDLAHDPDDGGTDVVLATLLAVDNDPVGTFYTLNTTAGGALVEGLDRALNAKLATPLLLDPGDIKLNVAGGGTVGTTARVRWDAVYAPWDDGATLTAVAAP
jgi:hypothetical protein